MYWALKEHRPAIAMGGRKWSLFSQVSFVILCCLALLYCEAYSSTLLTTDDENGINFLQCLSLNSFHSKLQVYTPNTTSYTSTLQSYIQNLRFASPTTPKPKFIITPTHESHVQAVVVCSKQHNLQIRIRSGGHDFEGLSYTSSVPFVLVDLFNLREVEVNIQENSAWVEAGATLGEVYYRIAEKSRVHGFSAGKGPTIGVGGHLSGAGHGMLLRKYGTAADNIVDARVVNVNGQVLNRETMGEDLFWAIRGGGAASFGVVLAWKIKLVAVPPVVAVSTLDTTYDVEDVTELVYKWQTVATHDAPEELYIELDVGVRNIVISNTTSRTIVATFRVMFLGSSEELMQLMEEKFPELGIQEKDCVEMSWIESVVYFALFADGMAPLDRLLNRETDFAVTFKVKSDYVTEPISKAALEGIWEKMLEEENPVLALSPWGGRVSAIPEHEIAFPHRAGNLYLIGYLTFWDQSGGTEATEQHLNWIREMYVHMTPYVSKSPRAAYFVFRDLDIGQNKINDSLIYSGCKSWGQQYFKSNCEKLKQVKSKVDPDNFFLDEQTIPAEQSLHSTI